MIALLAVNRDDPETTEPDEEGYAIPVIPEGGLSPEEWDELARRSEDYAL